MRDLNNLNYEHDKKLREEKKMDYELWEDIENNTEKKLFIISWINEEGVTFKEEVFESEEERQEVIDLWYAENDKFSPEQ